MRIGYCSWQDPFDKKSWSGLTYYMMKALEKHCGEVIPLGPLSNKYIIPGKIINKLTRIFLNKRFDYQHSILVSKEFAKQLKKRLSTQQFDILFFCGCSEVLAYLDTDIPIVYFSDTTFKLIANYYQLYSKLLRISQKGGNQIEARAIDKANIIIYSSQWPKDSAIKDYQCNENKISVVTCGANLDSTPSHEEIIIQRRKTNNKLKLLFTGVDWERKGGEIAFQTMVELNNRGIDAELTICGCKPPMHVKHEKLKIIGFLDKNDPLQAQKYQELFMNASIFFLPTRAECFALVFCEASAHGLPIVSTDTGGVSSYVNNGTNGYLLPLKADFTDYADSIQKLWSDKDKYLTFCKNSREKFENELNWDNWGGKINQIINKTLNLF